MTVFLQPLTRLGVISREVSEEILRVELQFLAEDLPDLIKYRDYLEGEQGSMVYASNKFKEEYKDQFNTFRSNWSAVVVDALADKLHVEGINFGSKGGNSTPVSGEDDSQLASRVWDLFLENDFDEQQSEIWEGAGTEGESYLILWPGDKTISGEPTVRMDWQRADLIRVRYADDDPRTIIWAMKRWLTPSGMVNITVYTRHYIYKYTEQPRELSSNTTNLRPSTTPNQSFERRYTEGEAWPLPNPYGFVPLVRFANKRGSELKDVIPLQDAVNYLMLQALTAAGYQGFPQRGFMTDNREPHGGWSNSPGRVWQIRPDVDAEGNLHYGSTFEFSPSNPQGLIELVGTVLQHIAYQTKTPVRMFYKSDRGGRGDAPSGDSLLVEDQPLLDKAEDRQRRYGNAMFKAARMAAVMAGITSDLSGLPLGEVSWHDPRSRYRTALVEEASKMVKDMRLPPRYAARHIGLSKEEYDILVEEMDAEADRVRQEAVKAVEVSDNQTVGEANTTAS